MTTATRRAILGAIACTPALAVSCHSQPVAAQVSGEMENLIAECRRKHSSLISACDALDARINEMRLARDEAVAAVPHYRTVNSYRNFENKPHTLSTANPSSLSVARALLRDAPGWQSAEVLATATELIAGAEAREAKIAEIEGRYNFRALAEQCDENYDAAAEALYPVIKFRSANLSDVVAKMNWLDEHDIGDWAREEIDNDVRRLAGEA